jgi:TolB protein
LYLKSVDGLAVTQLTSDRASDVQPVFSPDDTRVAFASDRASNWDIWVIRLDGGQPIQITDGLADEIHPSWSPDGRKLVYCSQPAQGGPWELWITEADGGSMRKFIGYGLFPQWSPVGDTILFQRSRERGSRVFSIWTLTLVDGEPRYPTEIASSPHQALTLPTWDRDGRRIAFTSVEDVVGDDSPKTSAPRQQLDIWLMSADGSGKVRLTDGHSANFAPAFSPDGRLFFTTDRSGRENIWSLVPMGTGAAAEPGDQFTGDPRGALPMADGSETRPLPPG